MSTPEPNGQIETQNPVGSSEWLACDVSSRPLKKEHRHKTEACPKCNLHPLLYRAGLWLDGIGWVTGQMWYECPGCRKRGGKAESHEQASTLWNSKVEQANARTEPREA